MAKYNILLCLPEDASYRSYQGIRCCMSGSITTIALTKLFTNHHHHQTRPSDISSDFSHQMSSRLLIQVSLISLSPISFQRTTAAVVGFRDVQRRRDQVPLSRSLTVFSSKFRFSDEILSAAAIADVCRLRGRSKLRASGAQMLPAQAGTLGSQGASSSCR